jgi:hypothetical protein
VQVGKQGVEGAAFTCEGEVLVSLGGSVTHQSVCVWDWRGAPDSPLASYPLKAGKLYTHLAGLLLPYFTHFLFGQIYRRFVLGPLSVKCISVHK